MVANAGFLFRLTNESLNQVPLAGAAMLLFAFFGLRGFFLCSSMGGEYDDAVVELAPAPGFAGCANAAGLPDVNSTATAMASTGVSLIMFDYLRGDWKLGFKEVRARYHNNDNEHSHPRV